MSVSCEQNFREHARRSGFLRTRGLAPRGIIIGGIVVAVFLVTPALVEIATARSSSLASSTTASARRTAASSASASCSASSRRLYGHRGRRLGGAAWYCHEWEKDFVEAVSTIGMIFLAMAFEHVSHHLRHRAEHAFVYGQAMLTDEEKECHVERGSFGKPLRLILLSRAAGEFMVLGFLAFTIWTCNQQNLFTELAKITASDMSLPTAGDDYLHMMEEVHMQLFVAMILYFALALKMTIGADERIKEFEQSRVAWIEQITQKTDKNHDTDPPSLREFKTWRGIFLDKCVKELAEWQTSNSHQFVIIMHAMNMNAEKVEAGTVTEDDVRDICTKRFSFCTYLVFSVCGSVHEFINMGHVVMLSVVCCKVVFAVLHRGAHVDASSIAGVLNTSCFIAIVCLYLLTHKCRKTLQVDENEPRWLAWLPGVLYWISHHVNPEVMILSTVQVLVFFLCHSWAGSMIDKNFWNLIFQDGDTASIMTALLYILALCFLGFILPRVIPDFAAVMSLPPFFSRSNEKIVYLVAVQVVDAKMVAARAQMSEETKEKDCGGRDSRIDDDYIKKQSTIPLAVAGQWLNSSEKIGEEEAATPAGRQSKRKEPKDKEIDTPLLSSNASDEGAGDSVGGSANSLEVSPASMKSRAAKKVGNSKAGTIRKKAPDASMVGKSGN